MRGLIVMGVVALASCAPNKAEQGRSPTVGAIGATRLDASLAGLVPGKPQSCLPILRTPRSTGFGETIVWEVSRALKYRNDTSGGCESLARHDVLVTQSPQGQLCRGDIAVTYDAVARFQTGSCILGDFIPYRRPK